MASVITSRRAAPAYLPSPADIEAATAEIQQRRLSEFDERETSNGRAAKVRVVKKRVGRNAAAMARNSRELPEIDANLVLQQNDQTEPIDLDEHRDPRQTEQWLPVPTVIVPTSVPAAEPNDWATRLEQHRREDIQACWDSRREHRELAADANARGVLNYYNINRGPRMPYHDRANDELFDMADRDIANVELLEFGQVDEALGMMIDAAEAQHEMEELNCRWTIIDTEPAPQPEVPPYKSATAWERRDVVAFRSKRK